LTVDDQGTVVLTGTNSYTGDTTVSAGTLLLTVPSAIAATTNLTVGAGGTFIFDPSVDVTSTAVVPKAPPAVTSSVSVPSLAGNAPAQTSASQATPPLASPLSALSHGTQTTFPVKSVSAGALNTIAVDQLAGSSSAENVYRKLRETSQDNGRGPVSEIRSTRSAGYPAWLAQAINGWGAADQKQQKDVAIQARDALFAQYGQ
jgi:autotransporter-associated beta strand protein